MKTPGRKTARPSRRKQATARSRRSSSASLKEQLDQRIHERDEAQRRLAEALAEQGYFVYVPAASTDAPAIVALRKWLTAAGRATEAALPEYLSEAEQQ
jgi:hypothetical protein